jgi:hypothetical protein
VSIDHVLDQIIYTSKQWELWDSHRYREQTARVELRWRNKQRTQKRDLEKHKKQTQKIYGSEATHEKIQTIQRKEDEGGV